MRAQIRRLRRAATGRGIAGRFSFFFFIAYATTVCFIQNTDDLYINPLWRRGLNTAGSVVTRK